MIQKSPTTGPRLYRHVYQGESCPLGLRLELDDIQRAVARLWEILNKGSVTITTTTNTGGGTGAEFWDQLKKRSDLSITAADAFGDWLITMDSLAVHLGKSTDPHGSTLYQSVALNTPLLSNISGNIRVLPKSGSALLIGESGGAAGSFRRVAIGDNPAAVVYTAISAALTMTPSTSDTYWQLFAPELIFNSNDATKIGRGIASSIQVSGTNAPGGIIGYTGAALVKDTAAPGYAIGVYGYADAFTGYSGTLPLAVGVRGEILNRAGTITEGIMFEANDPTGAGAITTLIGMDLPALTKGSINYGMRLGANTHLVNGSQIFLSGGNYYTEWRQESGGSNTIMQFLRARGSATTSSALNIYDSRGTIASPTASQNGDNSVLRTFFYDGTTPAWAVGVQIAQKTIEAWSNVARGTAIDFYVTPAGSTTIAIYANLRSTGLYSGGTTAATSTLQSGGSFAVDTTAVAFASFPYTATANDSVLLCTSGTPPPIGATVVLNLPTAVGCPGRIYTIVKVDAGTRTITITPNGAETINGAATLIIAATQWTRVMLISDGANWVRID